jgi:hypothetical protein
MLGGPCQQSRLYRFYHSRDQFLTFESLVLKRSLFHFSQRNDEFQSTGQAPVPPTLDNAISFSRLASSFNSGWCVADLETFCGKIARTQPVCDCIVFEIDDQGGNTLCFPEATYYSQTLIDGLAQFLQVSTAHTRS